MKAIPLRATTLSLLLLSTLLLTAGLTPSATAETATPIQSGSFSDFVLFRVYYDDASELTLLADLDIWENNVAQKYVLVAGDLSTIAALRADGRRVVVDRLRTLEALAVDTTALFEDGYRTVDELYADLDRLAAANPSLTELHTYGQSYCKQAGGCTTPGNDTTAGYDLRAIRISNEAIPGGSTIANNGTVTRGTKPILFVEAAIHAREITTPELAMRLAERLLDGHGTNADDTWLVDWHEIWIVPVVNPDGHWLVELGATQYGGEPLYHRKNANADANDDGTRDCPTWPSVSYSHFGVDLNRNHSFNWGLPGASAVPCAATYRGPAAASEPETDQREAFIRQLFADQRGPALIDAAPDSTTGILLTLHSYGNYVLYPWGFSTPNAAPNRLGLKAVSDRLGSISGARSCQPTTAGCLGGASGATDDWAYGELGIPGLTIEVGDQFMPLYSVIDSTQWPAFGPAMIHAAKLVREPYKLAFGPDVTSLSISRTETAATLTATVRDAYGSSQTLAAAEYSIDLPFWADDAVAQPLAAADGAFDEQTETVTAQFTVDAPGETDDDTPRIIFVRGRDTLGNWGPVSAFYLSNEIDRSPRITDFSPRVGGSGTEVTIDGFNLTGTTAVRFGGVAASLTFISDTKLTAIVPTGAQTGKVSLTTPHGTANSTSNFTVLPMPGITLVTPRAAAAGKVVTIDGTNLTGLIAVRFNGAAATDIRPVNATRLRVVVPSGATTGPISVTTAAGSVSSSPFPVLPTITQLTPAAAVTDQRVVVSGTAFTDVTSVTVNRKPAEYEVLSPTQIRLTVPAAAGTGKVIVTTAAGRATSKTSLRYIAAPLISRITPDRATVGKSVTIIGKNLRDTTNVAFNGRAAAFRIISATKLIATVPSGATTGEITAVTPGGAATSPTPFHVD